MNRDAWFVFAGLAAALALGLLGTSAWKKNEELHTERARLQEMSAIAQQQSARLAAAEQQLATAKSKAEALAHEMAGATNIQQRLESEMRAALQSRDVAISELHGRLTVNILDRILFDSGEASLKPEGMKVLDQVATVLAGFTNRQIQVFGHTDNVPIRLKFASNWELSTARALAAVRYLSEKSSVDPRRLSAVGCGEHQPIADNSTQDGRARNRRIALVVLPEQFVPTDVLSTNVPSGNAQTNNPAPALKTEAAASGDTDPGTAPAPILGLPTNAPPPASTEPKTEKP